ncbi:MAG TPA: hypothetical protein VNE39_26760 [Planctomycetota bacterium]|nr:hypothetical protein [Planctomycetota bacterium]
MRQFRRHLQALALLAYASVVLAGLDGHELCIGADGHVALELSDHRCCTVCFDYEAGDAQGAQWVAGPGGCGDCMDIPLGFAAADHHASHGGRLVKSTSAQPIPPTGGALLPSVAQASCLCLSALDFRSPPPRSVLDLSLLSVVLRI